MNMPKQDAVRWNHRYKNELHYTRGRDLPCALLKENSHLLPKEGKVLDVAMGNGRNAAFLAQKGFLVIGVDIAFEAVYYAKKRSPQLNAWVADLENCYLPLNYFDVILNFYYLQRSLLKKFIDLLKPGGLVFLETLTMPMRSIKPEISEEFLLAEGELLSIFSGWEILYYMEGWANSSDGKRKSIVSLIARSPK